MTSATIGDTQRRSQPATPAVIMVSESDHDPKPHTEPSVAISARYASPVFESAAVAVRVAVPPATTIRRRRSISGPSPRKPRPLLALGRFPEEADDLRQPAVGIDLADIDRRFAGTSIGADQPPQEADDVVMQLDTAHHLEPGAGPSRLHLRDVLGQRRSPPELHVGIDIGAIIGPAALEDLQPCGRVRLVPGGHVVQDVGHGRLRYRFAHRHLPDGSVGAITATASTSMSASSRNSRRTSTAVLAGGCRVLTYWSRTSRITGSWVASTR